MRRPTTWPTRLLVAASFLLVAVAPARAGELEDAQALRAAVAAHDSGWLESYMQAILGANYKSRSSALGKAVGEIVNANDSTLATVLKKKTLPEGLDVVLSVAAGEAKSWQVGSPITPADHARIDKVASPIGDEDTPYRIEAQKPPAAYEKWLYAEQKVNDKTNNTQVFAKLTQNDVPRELDPMQGNSFFLPAVDIPLDDAKTVLAPGDPATRSQMIIQKDGKPYVRFFMHPAALEYYAPLIKKYGLEQERFLATPTSSPRSLFVWDPYDPSAKPFVVKTSLPLKVGELRRVIPTDKIVRAVANSAALDEAKQKGQLSPTTLVLPEEMGVIPPDFSNGEIVRDLPDAIGKSEWLPGFALVGHDVKGSDSRLVQMIKKSGMDPEEFVKQKIFEPYLSAYAEIMLGQGLVGEPHQQNVLFEIGADGLPTGRVMFRDLDSYKPDIELRARRGLTLEPYTAPQRPTKMFKTAKGSDYYNDSFETYIKEDVGFMIAKDLKKSFPKVTKAKLYADMDSIMGDQVKKWLGVDMAKDETVSDAVKQWKDRTQADPVPASATSVSQATLKEEFDRGVYNYRFMWIDSKLAKSDGDHTYLLHDGVIEQRVEGKTTGFVFVEPPTAGADYFAGVPHPRQAASEGRLEQLYAPFDPNGRNAALTGSLAFADVSDAIDAAPVEVPAATPAETLVNLPPKPKAAPPKTAPETAGETARAVVSNLPDVLRGPDGRPLDANLLREIQARDASAVTSKPTIGITGELEQELKDAVHPGAEADHR